MRIAATLKGTCRWIVTALGLWLLFFVVDNLLALPAGLRLPVAVAGGALLVGFLVREVVLPVSRRLRPERVAILLETRYGIKDNLLINAFQFEGREFAQAEAPFAGRTITNCEAALGGLDIGQLWESRRLWPWAAGAMAVLAAWLAYAWMFPMFLTNAGQRFALPLAEIAPPGAPVITVSPAGDVVIAEGDSIDVSAEVIDRRPLAPGRDAPPRIVWIENAKSVPAVRGKGEEAAMVPAEGKRGTWTHTFAGVRRSFAFRVFAAGTHSGVVTVRVFALPKITASLFRVTPPGYTGLEPSTSVGPPAMLSTLAGSRVEVELAVEPKPRGVRWTDSAGPLDLAAREGKWRASRLVSGATPYEIEARIVKLDRNVVIARSQLQVAPDASPEVEFESQDRNRFVFPGTTVVLGLKARDDFGLREVWVTTRPAEGEGLSRSEAKRWGYMGPPGRKDEVHERVGLAIDPAQFRVGEAYLVEAWATDFNPAGKPAVSRPILIRIRSPMESDLDRGDPLVRAFERLRQSLAAQERAIGLAGNLRGHLEEAVAKQDLHEHRRAIGEAQGAGLQAAKESLESFRADEDGKAYAVDLAPLVDGEMPWVIGDIEKLSLAEAAGASRVVEEILKRQSHVRDSLLALLGKVAEERKGKGGQAKEQEEPSATTRAEMAKELKAKLNSFVRDQAKILKRSQELAGKAPADLSKDEEQSLGELARREADWAKDIKKKVDAIRKREQKEQKEAAAPKEDSLARKLEMVSEEVQSAANALYKKEPGNAVAHEQASLEGAAKVAQELDREKDDAAKPEEKKPTPAEERRAEPPAKLADKVGDLLDQQAAIGKEIENVVQKLSGASKKGVAGTEKDLATSSPGAKGMSDLPLPGEKEVGGRASTGPSGRSAGQMVGETAEAVGQGVGVPRLAMTPFEQGRVKDADPKDPGTRTGGGKLSGFSGVGLRGPMAPPVEGEAPRLAEKQTFIRQRAEELALRLRSNRLASGDLENSVAAMRQVENGLRGGDGIGVQSAYSRALDGLEESRAAIRAQAGVLRERSQASPRERDEITSGMRDVIPQGYEEMTSAYFRAIAEGAAVESGAPPRPLK